MAQRLQQQAEEQRKPKVLNRQTIKASLPLKVLQNCNKDAG